MALDEFLKSPWSNSHPSYVSSMLALYPAPENATAEVLVSSTYRANGYATHPERDVSGSGRELDKKSRGPETNALDPASVSLDSWRAILHGVIQSPRQSGGTAKRHLTLTPLVPEIALYSGSARLVGQPWNPGELVKRMTWMGARSETHANEVWQRLHEALSITKEDDAWARWLHDEFLRRGSVDAAWVTPGDISMSMLEDAERQSVMLPAQQFVRDLEAVLAVKSSMTRRQWISVLESVLRLGAVSHVIWLCRKNLRLWRKVQDALHPEALPLPDGAPALRSEVLQVEQPCFGYGRPTRPTTKDITSQYLQARLGLNLALWMLAAAAPTTPIPRLDSAGGMLELIRALRVVAPSLRKNGFGEKLSQAQDDHAKMINCKSGIGNNINEFCRYVLGQRQAAQPVLQGYDQGYVTRRRSNAKSAPHVLSLGPVAVLTLVHCCLWGSNGPRSVVRLAQHLAAYGISVGADEMAKGDLGQKLRMLGLVLDSPDAESGMLLVPPFSSISTEPGP